VTEKIIVGGLLIAALIGWLWLGYVAAREAE